MEPYPSPYEDVPASQIYMSKDVRKYGMIRKKSGGRKIPFLQDPYDLRFVVIHKGWVYYYKDKSSEKPQNKFSLQGFSNTVINAEEEEGSHAFVFKIYSRKKDGRTWYFATETKLDMEQWMEAFRLEIEQYNVRGISHIRPSKSCPEKPLPGSLGMWPNINNDRPQSVHAAVPMPERLPLSQFSSHTNMTDTSGIGSSTQSLEIDDYYEPVDVTDSCPPNPQDDDEFDTDSEDSEYEKPAIQNDHRICHYPEPFHSIHFPHPHPQISQSNFPRKSPKNMHEFGPAPIIPPRDPVGPPSSLQENPSSQQDSIFEELEHKIGRGRALPPSDLVRTPCSPPPSSRNSGARGHHRHHSPEPIPPPPFRSPPVLPKSPQHHLTTHSPLPSRSNKTQFQLPQNPPSPASKMPVHLRHRSEDPSINREHAISHLKRHSSPFSIMHEKLAEQLATKLGQPTFPSRENNTQQRPWSMAPNIPDHREVGSPSYHPSSQTPPPFSPLQPLSPRTLQPLPELPDHSESATERPTDLPPRPPPLPPGPKSGITRGSCGNPISPDHFSNTRRFGAEKQSSSLPNKQEVDVQLGARSRIPALPGYPSSIQSQPPLPPKPPTTELREPKFGNRSEEEYDDTGIAPEYDNNVTEDGLYDLPEGESYEQTYPECEQIGEAVYEEEARINKPLPPVPPAKHRKPPNPRQSQPKSPISDVKKTMAGVDSNRPIWGAKLKPTASPLSDTAENRPSWLQPRLKSVGDSKVPIETTSATSEGGTSITSTNSKVPVTTTSEVATRTPLGKTGTEATSLMPPTTAVSTSPKIAPKPLGAKHNPWAPVKKPPPAPEKPWQKDIVRPSNNSNEKRCPGAGARPPVSNKPKLPVTSKPFQPPNHSRSKSPPPISCKPVNLTSQSHPKPPPSQRPRPTFPQSSNFAKLQDKFERQ